jgi:hypothetical protein
MKKFDAKLKYVIRNEREKRMNDKTIAGKIIPHYCEIFYKRQNKSADTIIVYTGNK